MRKKILTVTALAVIALAAVSACLAVYLDKQKKQELMRLETVERTVERFIRDQSASADGTELVLSGYEFTVLSEEGMVYSVWQESRSVIEVTERGKLRFSLPWAATNAEVSISREGEEVYRGQPDGAAGLYLENGEYDAKLTCSVGGVLAAEDGTPVTVQGTERYDFSILVDIPTGFRLSRDEMVQGGAIAVIGTNIRGEVTATCPGVMDTIHFTVDDHGDAQALLSTTFRCAPGTYECRVTWEGGTAVLPFTVTEGTYEVQNLTISTSTAAATVGNSDAMADYNGMIASTNLIWTPRRYFDDCFTMPVEGPITTEFGLYRYTNGSSTPSRHVGIDIAADEGTPVKAAADGVVVVARWVGTTGYTVCIDHGYGVRSYYYHMSALTSEVGDEVREGETIGLVGMTGYANGPHVHFNIMVGDNSISPWPAMDGTSGIFDLPYPTEGLKRED